MRFNLAENKFKLAEEGRQVVEVIRAEGLPTAAPNTLEVEFKTENGATIRNNYTFDERNEKGFYVTSLFLQTVFGDITEFDTDMIDDIVGARLEVEVTHTEVASKKDPSKTNTFANISKIYGKGKDETAESGFPAQRASRL